MANVQHETLITANIHVPGYVQGSDPGAVGAGKLWTDTAGGTGFWVTKMRNLANDSWEVIGISGYSGRSGYSGITGITGVAGASGYSGRSGFSGANPGTSGYSGWSGYSGVAVIHSYTRTFVKTDTAPSGVLSVTHSLGTQYNVVQIIDDSLRAIVPDAIIFTDSNSLVIDLTSYYAIMSSTWVVVVVKGG